MTDRCIEQTHRVDYYRAVSCAGYEAKLGKHGRLCRKLRAFAAQLDKPAVLTIGFTGGFVVAMLLVTAVN